MRGLQDKAAWIRGLAGQIGIGARGAPAMGQGRPPVGLGPSQMQPGAPQMRQQMLTQGDPMDANGGMGGFGFRPNRQPDGLDTPTARVQPGSAGSSATVQALQQRAAGPQQWAKQLAGSFGGQMPQQGAPMPQQAVQAPQQAMGGFNQAMAQQGAQGGFNQALAQRPSLASQWAQSNTAPRPNVDDEEMR